MVQGRTGLRPLAAALVAVSWIACRSAERPVEAGPAAPGTAAEETQAPGGAVTPARAEPAASAPEPAAPVPLEKLLRLPSSPQAQDAKVERTRKAPPPTRGDPSPAGKSVRVDVEARQDVPMVRPDRSTDRVDVGVSVPVGESTRVRAGVRGERDAGEGTLEADRTPTLGIEKRF